MKKFDSLIQENHLFSNEKERVAFAGDKTKVAEAFVFNFLGILGLLNGAKDNTRVLQYFKRDKRIRLDTIGVRNNDFSLVVKLAYDLGMFRQQSTANQITRFIAKLKTGGLTSVNSSVVQEWTKSLTTEFRSSLSPRIRAIVLDFINSDAPSLHKVAVELKAYFRVYETVSGEYAQLAKRTLMKALPEPVAAEVKKEEEITPPKKTYPTGADVLGLIKLHDYVVGNKDPSLREAGLPSDYFAQMEKNELMADGASVAYKDVANASLQLFRGINSGGADRKLLSSEFDRSKFTKIATDAYKSSDKTFALRTLAPFTSYKSKNWKDVAFACLMGSQNHLDWFLELTIKGFDDALSREDVTRAGAIFQQLNKTFGIENLYGKAWAIKVIGTAGDPKQLHGIVSYGTDAGFSKEEFWTQLIADRFVDLMIFEMEDVQGYSTVRDKFIESPYRGLISPSNGLYGSDTKKIKAAIKKIRTAQLKAPSASENYPALFVQAWGERNGYGTNHSGVLPWAAAIVDEFFADSLKHPIVTNTYGYQRTISLYPTLRNVSSEGGFDVADKMLELQKNDTLRSFTYSSYAHDDRRPEVNASMAMGAAIFSQQTQENLSNEEIRARLDQYFEKYFPYTLDGFAGNLETALGTKIVHELYSGTSGYSNDIYSGGSEKARQFLMTCIVYNAEKFGNQMNISPQDALNYGVFDNVHEDDSVRILEQIANGNLNFLFSKENVKKIYRREAKRRVKDFYFGLILDNYEKHPDLVDKVYAGMEPYMQTEMRKSMVSANILIHSLKKGSIQPFAVINNTRMKEILSYNDIQVDEILTKLKLRKKKNETITSYIKRAKENLSGEDDPLGPLRVVDDTLSPMELNNIAVELQEKYRNGNHGHTHLAILRSFTTTFPEDDFAEFAAKMEAEGVDNKHIIPAFHGTGGVGATMVLRYGFRVISAGDKSVAGRMMGDGIYFTNTIDKAQQYCNNNTGGMTRRFGQKGYIIETDAQLGKINRDYQVAGTADQAANRFGRIRSPEWVARDGRAQLKFLRVFEVELMSKTDYIKMKDTTGTITEADILNYKTYSNDVVGPNPSNEEIFRFYDGHVFLPDGSAPWFEDVEDWNEVLPEGVLYEETPVGPSIVFTGLESESNWHDIRYATSMSDALKDRYFELMKAAVDAAAPTEQDIPPTDEGGITEPV